MSGFEKRKMEAYCGDLEQLFSIREQVLMEGKAKGTRAYHMRNGQGLELMALPDKSFTIPELYFKGVNVGFLSKSGICAPEFYQEEGVRGFLRNFEAGFLTICGLTYMGAPFEEDGQKYGLHGAISNAPAQHTYSRIVWEKEVPWIEFGGVIREAHLFGPNLRLHRKFRISTVENKILITDTVENLAFEKSPLMLLYHFNFGYPMLDESCKIYSNMDLIKARDKENEEKIAESSQFCPPIKGFKEEVFMRYCTDENEEIGKVSLHNENKNMAVSILFNLDELPVLNIWKNPRAGDYTLGLEPGTCHVGGKKKVEADKQLPWIEAGETKEMKIEIQFQENVIVNDLK